MRERNPYQTRRRKRVTKRRKRRLLLLLPIIIYGKKKPNSRGKDLRSCNRGSEPGIKGNSRKGKEKGQRLLKTFWEVRTVITFGDGDRMDKKEKTIGVQEKTPCQERKTLKWVHRE